MNCTFKTIQPHIVASITIVIEREYKKITKVSM